MTSEAVPISEFLEASSFHHQWDDGILRSWGLYLVRGGAPRSFSWRFDWEGGKMPRGYLDSVRQRFELGRDLPKSGASLLDFGSGEKRRTELSVEYVEGEPFLAYMMRVRPSMETSLRLICDAVGQLHSAIDHPRLISNIELNDFVIQSRYGVALEARLLPVFSVIREEATHSDYDIADQWSELVAQLYGAAKEGWENSPSGFDPMGPRMFRKLLKSVKTGRESRLSSILEELERCLRREMDQLQAANDEAPRFPVQPLGFLNQCLNEEFEACFPDRVPLLNSVDSLSEPSPFLISLNATDSEEESRLGALLPSEAWIDDSLIQFVNRKMAVPFLSRHPNLIRTRSLQCEEKVTLVVTDSDYGIALPSLFELKGGFEPEDALRFAVRIQRALDQFDSAEFDFEISSPWQIRVQQLGKEGQEEWHRFVDQPCEEWSAWDVSIRVEVPAEAVIESRVQRPWRMLFEQMGEKGFPALLVWMLEWQRFHWAAKEQLMEREPFSWDEKIRKLFEASAEHFEPNRPNHRERLITLLAEAYEVGEIG